MTLRARYIAPIQVVVTPRMRDRCKKIADDEGVSLASVYRDCIENGLPAREVLAETRRLDGDPLAE